MSSELLRFTIPGPPVPCARARSDGEKWYTPKKTRAFKNNVGWRARAAVGVRADYPIAEAVALVVRFYLPDRRRRDLDNLVKGVKDAMTGIVWVDDTQVCCELLSKSLDASEPRTEVFVYRFEPKLVGQAEHAIGHGILDWT